MAVVPISVVIPVVPSDGVGGVHVCALDGIALRMCEDNTSHPFEMPKLHLYPPDYKVYYYNDMPKMMHFFFFVCLFLLFGFSPPSLCPSRSVSRSVTFLC